MRSGTLQVACDVGKVSDGFHTFDELYEHRHLLFLGLLKASGMGWMSLRHADGTSLDGWFLAGMDLPTGQVTYHLPVRLFPVARSLGVPELDQAPAWDGHTSTQVLERLQAWLWTRE